MRETKKRKKERNKQERREIEEIKNEIRPSQFQTTITFDRKLLLRRATWPQKTCNEIYMVNAITITAIFEAKNIVLRLKNTFEIYLKFLVQFSFVFFLEII
jgi:hypothetical protein